MKKLLLFVTTLLFFGVQAYAKSSMQCKLKQRIVYASHDDEFDKYEDTVIINNQNDVIKLSNYFVDSLISNMTPEDKKEMLKDAKKEDKNVKTFDDAVQFLKNVALKQGKDMFNKTKELILVGNKNTKINNEKSIEEFVVRFDNKEFGYGYKYTGLNSFTKIQNDSLTLQLAERWASDGKHMFIHYIRFLPYNKEKQSITLIENIVYSGSTNIYECK